MTPTEQDNLSIEEKVSVVLDVLIGHHLCPADSVGCAKFAARGQMRHGQRQALNNIATKWGVK